MKKIIVLLIMFIAVFVTLNSITVISDKKQYILFEDKELKDLEIIEITTQREKDEIIKKDVWRGVRLYDIMQRIANDNDDVIDFYARDNYYIRLNKTDINIENSPIIAIERNNKQLDENKYRLIGKTIPEMHWISDITNITFTQLYIIKEPKFIYPYHTITSNLRLYTDPAPFVGIKAYKLWDLISRFARTSNVNVRIVSKDNFEQVLNFNDYLKNAYLAVDENKFSIYAPEIPTGMWQKDILLIQIDSTIIVFYHNIDTQSEAYQNLIKLASKKERTQSNINGSNAIYNWENLKWENIIFIQ